MSGVVLGAPTMLFSTSQGGLGWSHDIQLVVPGPAMSTSPGSLLAMQHVGPHLGLWIKNSGVDQDICDLTSQ